MQITKYIQLYSNVFIIRTICVLFLALQINCLSSVNAQSDDDVINKKVNFILTAAVKISMPQNDSSLTYKIGVFGKDKDAVQLYKELTTKSPELSIHEKPVEVFLFRRTRNIIPVDIFYVNGNSKIRISDIDKNLGSNPYFILTENFPFGTSMVNFSINGNQNIQFELQPDLIWSKGGKIDNKFLNSPERVHSEKAWRQLLLAKNDRLEKEIHKLERQRSTIEKQTEEIINKDEKIYNQKGIIYTVISFLLVVMALTYFLFSENRKRKKALNTLSQKNKEITDSIRYASLIQGALLPKVEQISNSFTEGFVLNIPKDIVSGDYYWHNEYGNLTVIAAVDSVGHGVPGAFLSVMGNDLFYSILNDSIVETPGLVLELIEKRIKELFNENLSSGTEGMDIVLVAYSKSDRKLYYAGAKRPLVMVRDGKQEIFNPTPRSVGGPISSSPNKFETNIIDTKPKDCIYLFTDGIQDQFGGNQGKKFGRKRLHSLLLENAGLSMKEQKQKLQGAIIDWKGDEEQVDDICLVGLRL